MVSGFFTLKWKMLFVTVVALFATSFSTVHGEDIDISKPLTLNQCIKIALERSTSMKAAGLNLEVAKLNVEDARANYLPEITTNGQYQFSDKIDFGWEPQNYNAQISASYQIWDHGRRRAGLAQARENEKGTQADNDKTRQDLMFSIAEAYYELLQAEKLIDVDQKLLDISRGNVEKTKAFLETGRAIPADVAAVRVQQASDELALINDQNNLELARARLASLMGLDPRTYIEIQDDPDYVIYTEAGLVTREVSLEDSVAKAIQMRPELIRLKTRLNSLEWSLKLAELDRWPVITADYGYNVLLDEYLRDRDNFKKYRSWSVATRVSFPLFDGGVSKRRERSAEIAVEQIKGDISDRERAIILEVQQSYLNLGRAKKSLDIAREQVKNAAESLSVKQGRYEKELVIPLEVLYAQAQYAQALTNQVKAFYNYKTTEMAFQKAVGTLKVED